MADLYSSTISGDSSYVLGANARKIGKPSSEFGTPRILPLICSTNGETLPGTNDSSWSTDSADADNYLSTSNFNESNSDIARAVKVIQQYCEVYEIGGNSQSSDLTIMVRESSVPYNAGQTFQNDGQSITVLTDALIAEFGINGLTVDIGRVVDDDTDG